MNSVRLIHIPSGTKQECQGRKRDSNLKIAMASMNERLDSQLNVGTKDITDDIRKKQIGSGMRGDKRRTYRFQDDTVVDHVTNKYEKASKVMKGGFEKLWPS